MTTHNKIMSLLLELIPCETNMKLPPNIFIDMDGTFLDFIKKKQLIARFPNKEKYMNPVGFMQGGIITAAIDNTASPLSYTIGRPSVTKEITTTFKRPITADDKFIYVTATIEYITETTINLIATVSNEKGKLSARADINCVFIKPR